MKLTTNSISALVFAALAVTVAPSFAEESDRPDFTIPGSGTEPISDINAESYRGDPATSGQRASTDEGVQTNDVSSRRDERDDLGDGKARVVKVEEVEDQGTCERTYVSTPSHQGDDDGGGKDLKGTLIGGLVGGVLGNQFGKGSGKEAATAVGAIAGALVGDSIANNNSRQQGQPTTRRVRSADCVYIRYLVTYEYEGQRLKELMDEDPGNSVDVDEFGDVLHSRRR